MNIRQLEAFRAVVELGSFTRAGQQLGLTQPAVSKLIFLLERRCGFPLFIRQRNGVLLTAEGKMLHDEVQRVFLGVASVAARAEAIGRLDHGEIKLVTFPSLAVRILPPILARFMSDRPSLRIEMASRNSWLLLDAVATQGVDLGFGMVASERPGLRYEKLCTMQAVCVLPPGHRLAGRTAIAAADLDGERFVAMLEEDRAQLQVDQAFAASGSVRNVVLKAQLTDSCCSFVAAGVGVAVVDPLSAAGFGPEQLTVRPFRPAVAYDIWVILPSFREPSLATQAMISHVREALSRRLTELAVSIGDIA
ncbi:LysR substrate-binding domain-containing protein [Bosea sp. 124]|uniref:LysR family transcriptional regulator n=1 Tax=Bosea sp. 124 TaxID=2135642 RepID=UPI000D3523D7|nr:LysR substrate-binding domain-containing protein [Bosea sp. 124]PTM39514.1 DNA-binding transcriptional LysR family regulator [Bosea sp. 124]